MIELTVLLNSLNKSIISIQNHEINAIFILNSIKNIKVEFDEEIYSTYYKDILSINFAFFQ